MYTICCGGNSTEQIQEAMGLMPGNCVICLIISGDCVICLIISGDCVRFHIVSGDGAIGLIMPENG